MDYYTGIWEGEIFSTYNCLACLWLATLPEDHPAHTCLGDLDQLGQQDPQWVAHRYARVTLGSGQQPTSQGVALLLACIE